MKNILLIVSMIIGTAIIGFIFYILCMFIYVIIKKIIYEIKNSKKEEPKKDSNNFQDTKKKKKEEYQNDFSKRYDNQGIKNRGLKNEKEKSILKYTDPNIETKFYTLNYPEPKKFECGDEIGRLIDYAIMQKRDGNYVKSTMVYREILEKYGPSGVLYFSWAKNLICEGQYVHALVLLDMANKSFYKENGVYDLNLGYHIDMLEKRMQINFYDFYDYVKTIAGNTNYKFPIHADVVINFIKSIKNEDNEKKDLEKYNNQFWSDEGLKNKRGESILKYIDPNIEMIEYLENYPTPIKFYCGDNVTKMLIDSIEERKKGNYIRANEICKEILKKDGPSGELYFSWGKFLMCKEHWNEALLLFKMVKDIYFKECGKSDDEFDFHIELINIRFDMDFYTFYDCMKIISENENYRFPWYGDMATKFKIQVKYNTL